ncbi:MAG: thioredoxin domain-containing protein [Bacillota bacterium]|nr:thioredoxin domain-containing protein [Bacillota bacterium]
MDSEKSKQANRLINEKSPYLLQHAYNPVEWYPWGNDAFDKARKENKPVFLSIGYSTCHWCHVMEKESFEDPEIADLLNKYFVPIKVDREERPDLDQIYMTACQALTGQGGWPLNVFLTPDKKPFFAGTYFPKSSAFGIHGLMELLPRIHNAWEEERVRVEEAANELTALLKNHGEGISEKDYSRIDLNLFQEILNKAYRQFADVYDHQYGGFGGAPKFPSPHQLSFLISYYKRVKKQEALDMAVNSLRAMHRGGIFDQLGYGIHRYSVDHKWLVPHFEKMLYDQATTSLAALDAYKASGDPEMAEFARKIFKYVQTNLTSPEGAFYSAEDADSEGKEGTFYVWELSELLKLLGLDIGNLVAEYFGVTAQGNFEGKVNVLSRKVDDPDFAAEKGLSEEKLRKIIAEARTVLLAARNKRVHPFLDDKIITAWNGLMIAALSRGASILGDENYLQAAMKAADFILVNLKNEEGMLLRRYRGGAADIAGFLEDYSFLIKGLIELYRASLKDEYLEEARNLLRIMLDLFELKDGRMLFSISGRDDELPVIAETYDGPIPSGLSMAAMNMITLGRALPDEGFVEKTLHILNMHREKLEKYPTGHAYLLSVLEYTVSSNEGAFSCSLDGTCGWE